MSADPSPRGCSPSSTPTSGSGLRAVPRAAGARCTTRGRERPLHLVQHLREGLPPQCIWMTQAKGPKGVVPLPEDFYIDMDVCMNCGLCSEYCPFDAIKMDQNFELSNYERHQTHIFSLQDLLVSSEYYARHAPQSLGQRGESPSGTRWPRRKTAAPEGPDRNHHQGRPHHPRPPPRRAAGHGRARLRVGSQADAGVLQLSLADRVNTRDVPLP